MPPQTDMGRTDTRTAVLEAVKRYWGYDSLRPIQGAAIEAVLGRRDSLVVMPTGGGKSLCYQVPPLITGGTTVVVSPLISLMKDQVDGLVLNGYPAAALHSGVGDAERADIRSRLLRGEIRLLFTAPERLLSDGMLGLLRRLDVKTFAIDEAHCISQWGHDFRPEYRRLAELREHFPDATFHAYTATATPRVREDIAQQLHLRDHAELVGTFDRPNLTYRILPRIKLENQIVEAIGRHEGSATIVYCISRKDTEAFADMLTRRGIHAEAYHAGLGNADRHRVQEDFANERLNVVVATVAFGMGIDRSDVRCVIHAAMPKSVEAYQQETGRAGRDGLPAECVLFYSAADVQRWKGLIDRSAMEADAEEIDPVALEEARQAQHELLTHIHRICRGGRCRHRALSEYFGQAYPKDNCGACDVCLGELEIVPDSTVTAQKILSCIARANWSSGGLSFGAGYIADVLRGRNQAKILERRHNELSTFGIMADTPREGVLSYIDQLIDLGVIDRAEGEYPTISLNTDSAKVLRGQMEVALVKPRVSAEADDGRSRGGKSRAAEREFAAPLTPDERALFDHLRAIRRGIAEELEVPPYVVFSDATLEEIARVRPGSMASFLNVRGVGQTKLQRFGEKFLDEVAQYCRDRGLDLDARSGTRPRGGRPKGNGASGPTIPPAAAQLFERGAGIDEVCERLSRAKSTVAGYLADWVARERPRDISPWISKESYDAVLAASSEVGTGLLRPIHERLGGRVSYEQIRIALAHARYTNAAGE